MNDVNKPALRFEGFEEVWVYYKLADIGNIQTGNTPPTKNSENYDESGTLWITPTDIKSNITTETQKKLSELGKSRARIADSGSILVTCIASIGKNTLIINECGFNQQINSLTPFNSFDSYFLFSQSYFWSKIMKTIAASGTMQIINKTEFSNLTFLFPKPTEQIKIGNFFKKLDNTIELQQQEIELLKKQKSGLLQKMFPKNGEDKPELRFEGFTDTWEERKLGEVIDIENGYAFKSEYFSDEEKRHIVLTPGSVKIGGGFQKDKGRYYDVSGVFPEKFIFKPGNIFITMTDLTPTAQSLGYPAIVPRDDNVYLHNQRLGKIINTTTNPEFLYTLLTTDTYHKEIVSSASGTTVKHSSVSKILDFKSAIPNIEEQKLIGSFFKELDNTIALQEQQLEKLKEMKKGYLQQMFI
ncbi:restriction endonuclease subunit S [Vagococcus fluvialis]|uniref:restriction endonuclease subunit S n=1 Tax=Vagococcus fluvialis TaxID=2738 RepID=UPI0028F74966|nr:restriction endonuclease subunit S [Vagococcus fluvialis]WNF91589.1 restriction endonuclease subunit S [Vagococcus fluvialis]